MPGQILTAPIKTVPAGMLQAVSLIGAIGEMSVIRAKIYGDEPGRWGVFVRVGDDDATLILRYEHRGDDVDRSVHALACIVFNTLHAAHDNRTALLNPHVYTDGLLSDDTATAGVA